MRWRRFRVPAATLASIVGNLKEVQFEFSPKFRQGESNINYPLETTAKHMICPLAPLTDSLVPFGEVVLSGRGAECSREEHRVVLGHLK